MEHSASFVISIEHFKPHMFEAEEGDGPFCSHSHPSDELTLILAGEGCYSSPEQHVKVGQGDLILIPPNLRHGFVCTSPWQGISVHFQHDKLPVYCQSLFHTGRKADRIRVARLEEDDLRWAKISLKQLDREWRSDNQGADAYNCMRIAFETLLLLFQRNRADGEQTVAENDQSLIEEVVKEIHAKYDSSITVHELASRFYLSESNLRKKFSEAMGVSPKQYIIHLRLREAKRLLQQTDRAIESICSEVGFSSSSRFYDFFIKSAGITPHEWRKQAVSGV